jgi:hypothetical protein
MNQSYALVVTGKIHHLNYTKSEASLRSSDQSMFNELLSSKLSSDAIKWVAGLSIVAAFLIVLVYCVRNSLLRHKQATEAAYTNRSAPNNSIGEGNSPEERIYGRDLHDDDGAYRTNNETRALDLVPTPSRKQKKKKKSKSSRRHKGDYDY